MVRDIEFQNMDNVSNAISSQKFKMILKNVDPIFVISDKNYQKMVLVKIVRTTRYIQKLAKVA